MVLINGDIVRRRRADLRTELGSSAVPRSRLNERKEARRSRRTLGDEPGRPYRVRLEPLPVLPGRVSWQGEMIELPTLSVDSVSGSFRWAVPVDVPYLNQLKSSVSEVRCSSAIQTHLRTLSPAQL